MVTLRRIFFYLFAVLYCVSCPLTVLYALGYIVEPGAAQGITKTGLISISSTPPGAAVYLSGMRYAQKTPTQIRDLLPGNYTVTIAMKNRRTWSKTVPVREEEATLLEKVVLLPKECRCEALRPDEFRDLILAKRERFFVLSKGSKLEEFVVYDRQNERLSPVVPPHSRWREARVLSYEAVEEEGKVLLRAQLGLWGEEKFFWIEPDSRKKLREAEGLESYHWSSPAKKIHQAFWIYEDSHILFRDGDHVYFLELGGPDRPEPEELFQVKRGSSILYRESSGRVYYLEKTTGRFCTTKLVSFGGVRDL